jgi:hypothetical protein
MQFVEKRCMASEISPDGENFLIPSQIIRQEKAEANGQNDPTASLI